MSAVADLVDVVREVSDPEVAFFRENGWVKLDGLVSKDMAAAMLAKARARLASPADTGKTAGQGIIQDIRAWTEWRFPAREAHEEPFVSVALAKTMGKNARRLLGREIPMRIWHDIVACKLPAAQQGGSIDTMWHQDLPNWAIDRVGLTMWIALDDVAPEQGLVRYLSGSFREGPLGRTAKRANASGVVPDLLDQYPDLLKRYRRSPTFHLRPGDVVCHHSLVVHGAATNDTARQRWSYLVAYFPEDALYTGAPNGDSDGLGLRLGEPLDHASFPLVRC